jgi:hypothetical protein
MILVIVYFFYTIGKYPMSYYSRELANSRY